MRGFQFQMFGGLICDVRIFKERKFICMFNDIVFSTVALGMTRAIFQPVFFKSVNGIDLC